MNCKEGKKPSNYMILTAFTIGACFVAPQSAVYLLAYLAATLAVTKLVCVVKHKMLKGSCGTKEETNVSSSATV